MPTRLRITTALMLALASTAFPASAQKYRTVFLSLPPQVSLAHGIRISDGQIVAMGNFFSPYALLWTGADHQLSNFGQSCTFYGVGGGKQVGSIGYGSYELPVFWSGKPDSLTFLLPDQDTSLFRGARAYGTDGTEQVGWGYKLVYPIGFLQDHALLWYGTSSYVDLQPDGYDGSYAFGVSGTTQVGVGGELGDSPLSNVVNSSAHALLWHSSASSVVDLHPVGFNASIATAVLGDKETGWGQKVINFRNIAHALLWFGTAASVVDLHPAVFMDSYAYGMNAAHEVGYGSLQQDPTLHHALVWSHTSVSAVDLHTFLPAGFISSEAYGIDGNGVIAGIATDPNGYPLPVLWVPTLLQVTPYKFLPE